MSEFHDPEMEHLLGRAGGPFPDVNVAYHTVQGRVRRAQRRRALATTGVAFALLLGVGGLAVSRAADPESVQPGDRGGSDTTDERLQPDTTAAATTSVAPTTTVLATTTEATTTTQAPDTTVAVPVVDPAAPDPAVTAGTTAPKSTAPKSTAPKTTTPKTTPTTAPPNTAAPLVPVDNGGATTPTTPTTEPKGSSLPVTSTFSGEGGSIVVRMDGNRLTLVSHQAAAGFQTEVRRWSGSHVEVRFESGAHRTVARVDFEDGTMVQHFEESDG